MRYAFFFLSIIVLAGSVLAGSPTRAFAATEYGKEAMSDTSDINALTITVDTVTTLGRNAFGSIPQGRLQTTEVVPVSIDSSSNPRSAQSLTAEEMEYWSTISLIEK